MLVHDEPEQVAGETRVYNLVHLQPKGRQAKHSKSLMPVESRGAKYDASPLSTKLQSSYSIGEWIATPSCCAYSTDNTLKKGGDYGNHKRT